MKQDSGWLEEGEPHLLYIAARLGEAQRLESLLTDAGVDYAVEADHYESGRIFRSVKTGAFFYVRPEMRDRAEAIMRQNGMNPSKIRLE